MSTSGHKPSSEGPLLDDEDMEARLRDDPGLARSVQLSRYLEGELSDEEADALEDALMADDAGRAELERMLGLDAALERAGPPPPRRIPWRGASLVGGGLLAAAMALFVLTGPEPLVVELDRPADVTYRSVESASLGSALRVEVPRWTLDTVSVRLYAPDGEVVTCPGASVCAEAWRTLRLETRLDRRGTYELLWARSRGSLPATTGDLEGDLSALEAADSEAEVRTRRYQVR